MRTRLGRRLGAVIGAMALAGGLLAMAGPGIALAADDCGALGGSIVAGECQVPAGLHAATGSFNLDETLHLLANAHIDATSAPATGISLTMDGDLVMDAGSIIEADDPCCFPDGNVGAGTVTIDVSGDVLLKSTSRISANNDQASGPGGDITITVDSNMTMCGPAGAQPGCDGPDGSPGALISAQNGGTVAGDVGGDVTITVGDISTATGVFFMEGGSTGYGTETGATIDVTAGTHSGDITITAGKSYFTEPGSVVQSGGHDGTANQQGGKIYIVAGCELTTQGRVTSKGPDPGADLVHLEGCEVLVRGLVESTGKGHTVDDDITPPEDKAPFNSCDGFSDSLTDEVIHDDKPFNATGCIEIWAKLITIDATDGWAGELNADVGDGGASGETWIDIYALSKLTVTDGAGNDELRDNLGGADQIYLSTYAVHANTMDGSDRTPNTITAKVKDGTLTASGKAFESSATLTGGTGVNAFASDTGHGAGPYFVGNGSSGGMIDLEASGDVTLDTAWVNASGDFYGGTPCPSGSGACGSGGHILVSAWATGSDLSWTSGSGDVRSNNDAVSPPPFGGDISLNACGLVTTTVATDFHGETVPPNPGNCSATKPDIPDYVVFNTDVWAICAESTISGQKFDDQDADGVHDQGEPGLDGWTIHLFNAAGSVHMLATTAGGGNYLFTGIPAGTYTVCEELPVVSPPWQQTFPTSGANCVTPGDPALDNPNPGPLGYSVDLTGGSCCAGQEIAGKDFGNVRLAIKTGIKWDDQANDSTSPFEATLDGWKIHLYGTAVNGSAVHQTTTTAGGGIYSFTVLPGSYTVCEELQANWSQTYPTAGADCTTGDPANDNPTPGPIGYAITLTEGETDRGNDFANHSEPVFSPPECREDPNRTFLQTRTVDKNRPLGGSPVNYHSIQLAYNDAANNAGEVIGLYSNTTENLDLGGAKTLTITQCTLAKVTASNNGLPVWWVHSTGKLTIIGPDSVGGTVGWLVETPYQTLKSVRAYNASQHGAWIKSSYNSVSFNSVSGSPVGVRIEGTKNDVRSGTISGNGTGVEVAGTVNTLSGSTVGPNTGVGVLVSGNTNTIKGVSSLSNGADGFRVTGTGNLFDSNKAYKNAGIGFNACASATGTKLKNNASNTGNSLGANENGSFEYKFAVAITNQGGNKKDNVSFANTAIGSYE
jgi:hypothetical protein